MQYREFLQMAGVTERDVPLLNYYTIERQYMERDDLFPDKDAVVAHYHRFGWRGFTDQFMRQLDTLRITVLSLKAYYANDFEGMLNLALTTCGAR